MHIGSKITKARDDRGLTLEVLSMKSGVPRAMLEQIEADEVNPTVATVWKIARALDIEVESLMKGRTESPKRFVVTHASDVTTLDTAADGPHLRVISPLSLAGGLEIYELAFDPGTALVSDPHSAGTEEFLTILSGSVRVSAGERSADLSVGDTIWYHSDLPHRIDHTSGEPARVHMVVRYDRSAV